MKFLHCADIHIDSPLRGLSRGEGVPADEIRHAARGAFDNLVALAVDEDVAAVVIAGDLYDGDRDDYDTALYLHRRFEQLREAGIPVVITYGNHDAASEITRRLHPPANVHVLPHQRPGTVLLDDSGLAFHGQSYGKRAVTADLSVAYPDPLPGYLNVGMLHTCLDGRPGHEPYAPCKLEALAARGYAYWALGHVHARDAMTRDGVPIVFPGNLQGRHARETGPKGATLVTCSGGEVESAQPCELDVMRWLRCQVDVSQTAGVDDVLAAAVHRVGEQTADADGRLMAVRLSLVGRTPTAHELARGREAWEAQLRANLAGSSGRVWLEKVELTVDPPRAAGGDSAAARGEAVAAVTAMISRLREDEEARLEMATDFSPLRSKLGADLTRLADLGCPSLTEDGVLSLLDEVELLLVSEIGGEE